MLAADADVSSNGNYNTTQSVLQNNTTPYIPQVTGPSINDIVVICTQPMIYTAQEIKLLLSFGMECIDD